MARDYTSPMFGFGKQRITATEAGANIMRFALTPIFEPQGFETTIYQRTKKLGLEQERFTFELMAFCLSVLGSSLNRYRAEHGGPHIAEKLLRRSLENLQHQLRDEQVLRLLPVYIRENAFEIVLMRSELYTQPAWDSRTPQEAFTKIVGLFADSCGVPDSEELIDIARSILMIKGNAIDYSLRGYKVTMD
jgi:hypothetical protein